MLYELLILDTSAELKPYQFYKNGKCIAEGTVTIENLIKLYFEKYLCDVKFVSELKTEGQGYNPKKLYEHIESEFTQNNNIVYAGAGQLLVANLDEFIKQPIEGMLYDLNRDELVVMSFVGVNPKWINDYAVCKVIRALKNKIDKYETEGGRE